MKARATSGEGPADQTSWQRRTTLRVDIPQRSPDQPLGHFMSFLAHRAPVGATVVCHTLARSVAQNPTRNSAT